MAWCVSVSIRYYTHSVDVFSCHTPVFCELLIVFVLRTLHVTRYSLVMLLQILRDYDDYLGLCRLICVSGFTCVIYCYQYECACVLIRTRHSLTYTPTNIHTRIYTYILVCIRTYTYILIYTGTLTHIHTDILYAQVLLRERVK